jgi:hypothetical protein
MGKWKGKELGYGIWKTNFPVYKPILSMLFFFVYVYNLVATCVGTRILYGYEPGIRICQAS